MRINITIRELSDGILYYSVLILIILAGLPLSQALPSIVRQALQIISVAMFFGASFLNGRHRKTSILIVLLILFFMLYFFGTWSGHGMTLPQYAFNVVTLFVFCSYGIYLIKDTHSITYFNLLYKTIVAITVITAITTTVGLIHYPLAVRDMGRTAGFLSDSVRRGYMLQNIGSWHHLYGITFVAPSFLWLYKKTKSVLYIVYWGLCEIMIITSQVTYAFVLSGVFVVLLWFDFSKKGSAFLLKVASVFIVLIVAVFFQSILTWMITFLQTQGYSTLASKLEDLLVLLYHGSAVGDANGRFGLYFKSLRVFAQHPIGGLFFAGKKGFDLLGFHSDIFDLMGYFGLIGVSFLGSFCAIYCRMVTLVVKEKRVFLILFGLFLVAFLINPMLYAPIVSAGVFIMPNLIMKKLRLDTKNYLDNLGGC